MLSFWEKQSLLDTDVAIIGGGIVGLSVAASIKERWPEKAVTVLERSVLPYGASTRNAGFACFGSLTEVLADVDAMGESAAAQLLHDRWTGLHITRKRLSDAKIGFQPLGGYEFLRAEQGHALDRTDEVNRLVHSFLPDYISLFPDGESLGLKLRAGDTLVRMRDEGQLDTGRLMKTLAQYVASLGVEVRTGAQVRGWGGQQGAFRIEVGDGVRPALIFGAREVVVCVNAFAEALVPGAGVEPGRGQVLITEEIPNLPFRGNLHMDEGFYYLRNVGNRLLFGGGRNLDFAGETTTDFDLNYAIQNDLETKLVQLFAFAKTPEVDMRWAGIMAFGADKTPIVKRCDGGVVIAVKMSGMGIALAGKVGEVVMNELGNG